MILDLYNYKKSVIVNNFLDTSAQIDHIKIAFM